MIPQTRPIALPRVLPHQRAILQSASTRRLLIAGVGAGKTHAAALLVLKTALEQPGIRLGWFAPDMRIFLDVDLPVWEQIVPDELYSIHGKPPNIHLRNGSVILCRGLDQPHKRIIGLNLAAAVIDEAGQMHDDVAVKMVGQRVRVGDPSKRFVAQLTSPHGSGWLSDWSAQKDRQGRSIVDVIHASTYDNPYLPPSYIADLEVDFPPGTRLHRQEMLGEFLSLTGLVYGEVFDRTRHSLLWRGDPHAPYELGVDFGYRASGWVAFQRHPSGAWCAVREWLPEAEFTEVSAARVLRDMEHPPSAVYCDTPTRTNTRAGISDVEALASVFGRRCTVRVVAGHIRQSRTRHLAVCAALNRGTLRVSTALCPTRIIPGDRSLVHALETLPWPDESTRLERQDNTDPRKHVVDALEFFTVCRVPYRAGSERLKSAERA